MKIFLQRTIDRLDDLAHSLAWLPPLVARLTVGATFVVTGWGKVHNLDNVGEYFASLHIPAPHAQAVLASFTELGAGLLLVAGLATRLAALPLIVVMTVAIATAKWADIHGAADLIGTLEATYIAVLLWLAVAGAGSASADHLLSRLLARRARGGESPNP